MPHDGQLMALGPSACPHWAQNLAVAALSAPQASQWPAGGGRAAPQEEQNLLPAGCCGLAVGAGHGSPCRGGRPRAGTAAWSRAAAHEARAPAGEPGPGGRDRARLAARPLSACHLSTEAQSRSQEGALVCPAALGHALAGSEGHLTGRVPVEPTGQAACTQCPWPGSLAEPRPPRTG